VLGLDISVSFSFKPLAWASGKITVAGEVEFHNPGPNQWIEFSQALTLELNASSQTVSLKPVGEPSVDESFFIRHSTAVRAVKGARDAALAAGAGPINDVLRDAKRRLNNGLKTFDASASATFTGVEITSDGIIVRGDIGSTTPRYGPIIDVRETNQGRDFTALHSWIPGGRIQQHMWSWVEYANASVWSGVTKISQPFPHHFIFPKAAGITDASQICLRIQGTQTSPQGVDSFVVGGTFCRLPDLGQVFEAPSWEQPVTVPMWLPDLKPDVVLKDAIAGHISVQADVPKQNEPHHNFLVYFADWRADKPLNVLSEALNKLRRKDFSLVAIAVLPAGAFDSRRRDVEARLDSILERSPARLLLTEDYEGGWTRTFAVSKIPSTYLMNARREFVWKHEGEADPSDVAKALDERLVAGPVPRAQPLRLDVSIGDRAPDILFGDERGNHIRLRWLLGQSVVLNFWQSWSTPSINELLMLDRLAKERAGGQGFIVAFHGGKEPKMIDEIRKQHRLSLALAHDPEQRIARIYGVRCWPTTISINADGLIEHVQFGATHEHAFPTGDRKTEAY
jgi:peroxiredoxin